MRRREFLSLALAVPVTGWGVAACAASQSQRGEELATDAPTALEARYSDPPGDDVIQGVADTPSPAWHLVYASMPLPGDCLGW